MKSMLFRNVVLYRPLFNGLRIASVHRTLDQHRQIAGLFDARQAELGIPAESAATSMPGRTRPDHQ